MTNETGEKKFLTRGERLERLPMTGRLRRLVATTGVGWALDAMDVGLISFVVAALAQQWGLSATERSWIISIGFVGMAIGATVGGLLADKLGRRMVFALTLLVYGLATGASALAGSVVVLMLFRFIVGIGLGAELPVASTFVSEFAPRKIRGRVIVWLEAFWALGWIAAALIGYFVVAPYGEGWRWGLLIGAVPALYALVIRLNTRESVRFLELRGQFGDAEATVRLYEDSAGPDYRYDGPASDDIGRGAGEEGELTIWSAPMRKRTIALWTIWFMINFSYYGAFTWIPSLLTAQGFTLVRSFEFTLIMTLAQIPGYAAAAWLIEVVGRRRTLALFLAGSAVSALMYGQAAEPWQIIAAGMALSFFNLGAWGALYAIGPELYPTTVRGTGTGSAAGFGRIASILTPLLTPVLVSMGGNMLAFTVFSLAFACAALAAFALPEQKGASLR
ncbi:MFS transporter [Trueperella pecoris]|uniref:MFS transporter n=1 Tax=Trueperella pecoris TaxID=2733571 RepID=UPI00186B6635|nr:MFS transporter [Trueperella pecoris]QOQ38963.1 MFS transporter [Trueperella pecoris]